MIKTRKKSYLYNSTKQRISTVYTLLKTIRSKIFHHNKFIKTLDTKNILHNINNLPCNYTTSQFTVSNHRHNVTGDILIDQKNK